MKSLLRRTLAAAVFFVGVASPPAHASVVIGSTRVVFPAGEREVTVKVTNDGKRPALVQAWLDKGNANESPENLDVPFTLAPAMFRLDPAKGQTLRLIYTKAPLPADRESLFWLNVLEVPPKDAGTAGANQLQVAFRTRIKVLFRPQGLAGRVDDAPAQARWELVPAADGKGYALKASNPTPYYINLSKVEVNAAGQTFDAGAGYIAPGQSQLFPVAGLKKAAQAQVSYTSINDWGAGVQARQPVAVRNGS